MLRVEVREDGQPPLPPIDLDDRVVVIGSDPAARVRLPAQVARGEHVRIEAGRWRSADGEGAIGDGVEIAIGAYRVRIAPAPAGAVSTPPQRTASLARELLRGLLGDGSAPTLEVERGPLVGAKRALAPPDSVLVIGRGDEATWVIVDEDLSRVHAEVRRGWDGVRVVDRESRNGTRVDGKPVREAPLHDGALVELGAVAIRFRDPAARAEAALLPPDAAPAAVPAVVAPVVRDRPAPATGNRAALYAAVVIAALAVAGLVWVLSS
jgi:hypothetical protein